MLEPVDDVDPDEPGLDRVLQVGVPQRVGVGVAVEHLERKNHFRCDKLQPFSWYSLEGLSFLIICSAYFIVLFDTTIL